MTDAQREQTRVIFQALGKGVFLDDEKYLDMATAVSGTGPTYVFLVLEALIDAAVLGFPRHLAHDIVIETTRGSIVYAQQSNNHPAELRNMVTSPGGTSAEDDLPNGEGHVAHRAVESGMGGVSKIAAARRVGWQSGAKKTGGCVMVVSA